MTICGQHRQDVIKSLLERTNALLDLGCGPLTPSYPYADAADSVMCVDWKLRRFGKIPNNIQCIEGDIAQILLPSGAYSTVIAADVFEHITLEQESEFARQCLNALAPGGYLIVSVPHRGTFAWLDPYQVKPLLHRALWHLGLYGRIHDGFCDIRKGHKHYTVKELAEAFAPLEIDRIVYWNFVFDPLASWLDGLTRGRLSLDGLCRWERSRNWGSRSFNVAVRFRKQN